MQTTVLCLVALAAIGCSSAFTTPCVFNPARLSSARLSGVTSGRAPRAASLRMKEATALSNKEERTVRAPVFDEVCEQTGITLTRYMMEVARSNPELRDLESLIGGISLACKTIANLVDRATITGMVSYPFLSRFDCKFVPNLFSLSIKLQFREKGYNNKAHKTLPEKPVVRNLSLCGFAGWL